MYDEFCVTYIGVQTNDKNICDIYINDQELDKDQANYYFNVCYNRLAWKLCDASLCEKIYIGGRGECISNVNEKLSLGAC